MIIKNYKCPICGCDKHYLVTKDYDLFSFDVSGVDRFDFNLKAKPYLCSDCGHVEFFAEELLNNMVVEDRDINKQLELLNEEIKERQAFIDSLNKTLESSNKELDDLNKLIKNDEIPVKEHNTALEKKEVLVESIKQIENKINISTWELNKVQEEVNSLLSNKDK